MNDGLKVSYKGFLLWTHLPYPIKCTILAYATGEDERERFSVVLVSYALVCKEFFKICKSSLFWRLLKERFSVFFFSPLKTEITGIKGSWETYLITCSEGVYRLITMKGVSLLEGEFMTSSGGYLLIINEGEAVVFKNSIQTLIYKGPLPLSSTPRLSETSLGPVLWSDEGIFLIDGGLRCLWRSREKNSNLNVGYRGFYLKGYLFIPWERIKSAQPCDFQLVNNHYGVLNRGPHNDLLYRKNRSGFFKLVTPTFKMGYFKSKQFFYSEKCQPELIFIDSFFLYHNYVYDLQGKVIFSTEENILMAVKREDGRGYYLLQGPS